MYIGKQVGVSVYSILDQSFKSIKKLAQNEDKIELGNDPQYGDLNTTK
jgi:hypothetical protein